MEVALSKPVESDAYSERSVDEGRRDALRKMGTYAAFTPPAMAALLTATKANAHSSSGWSKDEPEGTHYESRIHDDRKLKDYGFKERGPKEQEFKVRGPKERDFKKADVKKVDFRKSGRK